MKTGCALLLLTLWPMLGGALSYLIGRYNKTARDYTADAVCFVEFALAVCSFNLIGTSLTLDGVCGLGLSLCLDGFRFVYSVIIAFMWLVTTVFSREYLHHHRNRNRYYLYVLMTLGAIMGVFLSADLFTTFVFFEMMSLFSYVMVAQDETGDAQRAAQTYLAIARIGGLATLTGLVMLYSRTGTLEIASLSSLRLPKSDLYVPGVLIFTGFAAKAAIFPSHIWLPTAHTAAPAPSSALLSGLLTKSGLFGILVLSSGPFIHDINWGMFLLVLALITMVLGAVLAVFSVNIKRTLACSSMSQLGFILTGVAMQCLMGENNDLAIRGTVIYMIGHSLIKLVLFLCAGVVHMNTHKLELNEIRGFGRGKKVLMFAFLMGALALMGVPFWNGYLGKTLIHESIVEHIGHIGHTGSSGSLFVVAEWLFLISGGLTAAYMLKLFVALFIDAPSLVKEVSHSKYLSFPNSVLLALSALILPLIGMLPYEIADRVSILCSGFMNSNGHHHIVSYFALENLKGSAISLIIGVLVYLLFIRRVLINERGEYVDLWPSWLNIENMIYRPLICVILPFIGALFARILDLLTAGPVSLVLSNAARIKFIKPPEDLDFGFYHDEPKSETAGSLLPSSLAYGLMAFAAGLLFVTAFLML
ncbi:MAG: hypothetical protein IJT58_03505 [Synergistaceae bacterium]|nr:hypothetical protein [Synergistaceae bacterium]